MRNILKIRKTTEITGIPNKEMEMEYFIREGHVEVWRSSE